MTEPSYRLPRQVVPRHYRLRMEPDLDTATFTGSEVVTLDVVEATDRVVLNAAELQIVEARFVRGDASAQAEVEYDEELQRAVLLVSEPLSTGRWELRCRFTGILNDQLRGFYRSTFDDEDGNEQVIATTQFEATDARRAFPCWDEPDFKASFGVTLVVPEDLMAVSNGAEIERVPLDDGRVAVTFADTIVMSTYLVAFVVGPFEATAPIDVNGVPVRIVAPRGKLRLTGYALECSRFCLDYLATYYGIPYPGDKVDMVAIPDFAFGAMENLGCITYRESVLLVDEEIATSAEKMRILDVIGHELAHMWFGDLVTMKWWNGIWLNEAFATFMEMKAVDAFRPEWKRWLEFAAAERPWAFKTDELAGTRPVEFEVRSPAQAEGMFDGITYGKGSAVLRMMEQYLGEEPFRAGVESYLRRHAYGNTETRDLWESLDDSSGRPVGEIMDTWILQGGYPQLTVGITDGGLSLEQSRFLLIPDPADTRTWKVPVRLRGMAGGDPFETSVLVERSRITVPLDGPVDWVIANAGGHGFYRSRYEETLLDALVDRLQLLDPVERFVLVDDAWTFVEAGRSGVSGFVSLASAFREEQEQAVWGALLGAIAAIGHHLVTDDARPRYERWVAGLLAPLADRLGWAPAAGETDLVRRLRGRVIDALGRMANLPEVVERAGSVYERRLANPTSVDPEVAGAVISVCAAHGDAETYERFLDRHRTVRNPQESLKYLRALASFDAEDAVDRTFELIEDRTVRNQDTSWVLARMLANRGTGSYAWSKFKDRWDTVLEIAPPMTQSRIADGFPALSHPEVAADVAAFLAENPLPHAAKAVEQKLERLSALVQMRERETGAMAGALPA
ncbi:MAG: M1 family metallopeptidase [bacterium]|nr:M1 family metallopeptidase [bacterium]MDE0351609.1 M1 family metallopeptidase [bacterium]